MTLQTLSAEEVVLPNCCNVDALVSHGDVISNVKLSRQPMKINKMLLFYRIRKSVLPYESYRCTKSKIFRSSADLPGY